LALVVLQNLFQQHVRRPAIKNHVLKRKQQNGTFSRQANQGELQQGSLAQVKTFPLVGLNEV